MTTAPDLLATVAAGLITAKSLGYSAKSAQHDLYEAYVLTIFLEAAVEAGWQWDLRDKFDQRTDHAVFREGPGRLFSGDFTHARLSRLGRRDLEAHIGIKVVGKVGVAHEFDLLVLPSDIAAICRAHKIDPRYSAVVSHAEAKYHGANLALHIGRAMVGLAYDCELANKSVLVTNRNGLTVENLIGPYGIGFRFMITPGTVPVSTS